MSAVPLVFLDTETTGLHANRRAWEVAAIRREPGGSEARYQWLVTDVPLDDAEPAALRIGRFYERHPDYDGPPSLQVYTEHAAAVDIEYLTRGARIVGSNPRFDEATLDAMLRRHRLCPAWDYRLVDVLPLAAGYLAARGELPADTWRSYELSELCGVPRPGPDAAHTAMGDALWARDLYDRVMGGVQS